MMLKQSAVTCLKYAAVQAANCWVQDNLALQLCFNVFLSMQFVEVNIIYTAVRVQIELVTAQTHI
jgi:hypothetical protein